MGKQKQSCGECRWAEGTWAEYFVYCRWMDNHFPASITAQYQQTAVKKDRGDSCPCFERKKP